MGDALIKSGKTIKKGIHLTDLTLAEMDAIWEESKTKGL